MAHIMRVDEGGYISYNQEMFLKHIIDNGDLSVVVDDITANNIEISKGEMFDSVEEFADVCKSICERINGTSELSCNDGLSYNIFITDEDDEMYASIDFKLVYYNRETLSVLENIF